MPDAELVEQDADRWQGLFLVVALVVSMMLADLVEFGGIGGAGGVGGLVVVRMWAALGAGMAWPSGMGYSLA